MSADSKAIQSGLQQRQCQIPERSRDQRCKGGGLSVSLPWLASGLCMSMSPEEQSTSQSAHRPAHQHPLIISTLAWYVRPREAGNSIASAIGPLCCNLLAAVNGGHDVDQIHDDLPG